MPRARGAGPHDRQRDLQRRDAAPGREEIAVVDVLERRRRGRVIGGDQIDASVVERAPQALAMLALADRRRALQRRVAVGDLFGAERQVVRTGFDGERHARGARAARSTAARPPTRGARCARARRCATTSSISRSIAACSAAGGRLSQPGRVAPRIGARIRLAQQPRATRRAPAAAARVCARIGIASRRSDSLTCSNSSTPDGLRKALEAEHAGARERLEVGGVAGHDAAPEADVDVTSPGRGAPLGFERGDRGRGRNAVERHVDERGDAAGGRGERRRFESFPVGAARIVDVHVRIDEAGHHDGGARVDQRCLAVPAVPEPCLRTRSTMMRAVVDADRRRTHAVRQHDALAANQPRRHRCISARASP